MCHICVLVICIRTYIYRRLVGQMMINHGIQALFLEIRKKMKTQIYHYVVTMSTEE